MGWVSVRIKSYKHPKQRAIGNMATSIPRSLVLCSMNWLVIRDNQPDGRRWASASL